MSASTDPSSTLTPGSLDGETDETTEGKRLHPALKVLIALFILASMAMWAYGLWGPRQDPPGTLDDPAYSVAAEAVCAQTLETIDALPLAQQTTDADERADVVETANAALAIQLDELEALAPTEGEDQRRVSDWLADWRTYLVNRVDYAERLHEDRTARLLETEKAGDHISQALQFFAVINRMPSCAPPGDVG